MASFFDKIKQIFNPGATDNQPEQSATASVAAEQPAVAQPVETQPVQLPAEEPAKAQPAKDVGADNVPELRQRIVKAIIAALKPLRGSEFTAISIHAVHPTMGYAIVDSKDFEAQLRTAFDNNMLESLGKGAITVTMGDCDVPGAIDVLDGDIKIVLKQRGQQQPKAQQQPTSHGKAVITLIEGTGSLHTATITLDTTVKTTFHIGRGKVAKVAGHAPRINDVAADESDERMMRVSRAHADILWRNGAFYLKALPGGCRPEGGSATKVVRDEKYTELRDLVTMFPLLSGDMIELGGELLLTFTAD